MKWADLLLKVSNEPVFRTGFLAASQGSLEEVRLQLSRWVKTGRLIQVRKGLYTLAQPYRKVVPHPFVKYIIPVIPLDDTACGVIK